MERKANLQPPTSAPPIPPSRPPGAGDAHTHNTTSSSSSTSPHSPPEFLRHMQAVFKRHRSLGTLQSNGCGPSRVLVPPAKSTAVPSSSLASNNIGKRPSHAGAPVGAARLPNAPSDPRKEVFTYKDSANPIEDSSMSSPTITGTMSPVGRPDGKEKASLVAPQSRLPLVDGVASSLTFQSSDARTTIDSRTDGISSYFRTLALTEGEAHSESRADDNLNLGHSQVMDMSGAGLKFERRAELQQEQQRYVESVSRYSAAGTTMCATTMSVHSGPTVQCTRAPSRQMTSATQMSSSAAETALGVQDHTPSEAHGIVAKDNDGFHNHHQAPRLAEDVKEKGVSANSCHLQSQAPPTDNVASNVGSELSRSSKVDKPARKKKYDPDVFFKVNGKLYQKLGKIGSGGSSEVHKVISSDCTIFALKKIKLKGRDYPTAYGFCQEIEYLQRLKGKSNIIQLIDYEVTDKYLLQGVMNGSMDLKEGKIRDDQYIYMVLEYGEIDLAHMLSHKWKEMDSSSWKIDENWLRFYWQQMLEAVNTIHEERIVHSDLKPANFLLVRGSLKLIDFGIAKAIMSDTTNIQRDAQVGTLNYMSPEAFMWNEQDTSGNTIKCGRPSDIWSLGCILYQMVYGKTPFAEYKTFWAKFKVITDRNHMIKYEPVSNPSLIDLMRRCLAWDRNERWRIPELLQHPFLVPPIATTLPPFQDHSYKLLVEKVGIHWHDPEVRRLCSELHEVIANLDKRKKESGMHA